MNLYDLLACPTCKIHVTRQNDTLHCPQCNQTFPIINNVPIMFPDGSVPHIQHEAELHIRTSYDPWVHRVILQSLLDDQIVLDVGSGNMALDDPNIIRMDVTLSPYVDLVGDIHALPFLPGSLDYVFSLAVFEHLRNPFLAAQSIYETLKDGGYFYHECNFVFAYHGYPHHYFNASLQGMEQVFSQFVHLKKGVAPYQMPSFTLLMVLHTYLQHSQGHQFEHGRRFTTLLEQVLALNTQANDIYFTENDALYVAAGTYVSGLKQDTPQSSVLPHPILDTWENNPTLQTRFPNPNNLTTIDNLLRWAREEGAKEYTEIAQYLQHLTPFQKHGENAPKARTVIRALPFVEPKYGAIGFEADQPLETKAQIAAVGAPISTPKRDPADQPANLLKRGLAAIKRDGWRTVLSKALIYTGYRLRR